MLILGLYSPNVTYKTVLERACWKESCRLQMTDTTLVGHIVLKSLFHIAICWREHRLYGQ